MTGAPGSWSRPSAGLNARGALRSAADWASGEAEAGQKARSTAWPSCAVCRGARQRAAV
jgi:hypothetical protein